MLRNSPFAERDFRLLLSARTISFLGNAFATVALAFAVLDLTGSKADLGYVLAARSVPTLVFLLVGGIWSDRLPRHRVMVVSNVVSGASQAAIAILLFSGHAQIWQLAALGRGRRELGVLLPRLERDRPADRARSRSCSRRTRCCGSAATAR